jgi:hypothetical protein
MAQQPTPSDVAITSLPHWALGIWNDSALQSRFDLFLALNPFIVSGDFDGDNRLDVAIAVRARSSGKRGIIVLSRARPPIVLGAGTAFGNGGDDFFWLDAWQTEELGADRPPAARSRFAIYVEKMESASAWIYWDGRQFRWHQLGD